MSHKAVLVLHGASGVTTDLVQVLCHHRLILKLGYATDISVVRNSYNKVDNHSFGYFS